MSRLRIPGMRLLPESAVVLCALAMLLLTTSTAFAAGNESLRRAYDLALTVDSRWAGGASGGYYPIRIRVTNTARPRTLLFRFVDTNGGDTKLPTVERRVLVDQNATAQFTLSIPLVSYNSSGELRVYENGRLLDQFTHHLAVPDASMNSVGRPSLLVIHPSPATTSCEQFELALQSLVATVPTGGGTPFSGWGGYPGGSFTNDSQVIAPALLPESWIDYTGLDIVAIPLATLDKLPSAARSALLQWTETGGTLLITEVGEPIEQSKDLAKTLDLINRPAASRVWHPPDPAQHRQITLPANPSAPGVAMPVAIGADGNPIEVPTEQKEAQAKANRAQWAISDGTFRRVDLMAGRVYAFPQNPFPGAPIDWAWWLNTANWNSTLKWTTRLGNSTRERHPGFFEFLIPGVGGVPVIAFVLLISVFAVIIGPVNYFVVLRRKKLYLLVVTIPAIAFLTSCTLFGYSMIADGFRIQSRLLSYTLLDQGTKHAVSFNRISLFAGLAPSDGLKFSPNTAVLPIWSSDSGFEGGLVDWTDTQALAAGWLRSRTRTQFETIENRVERRRVEFTTAGEGAAPDAQNGLEWTIDALVVKDEQGRVFSGRNLPAGASLRLRPVDPSDLAALRKAVTEFPLKAPAGAETDPSPFSHRMRRGIFYGLNSGPPVTFSQSLIQRGIEQVLRSDQGLADNLAPRSYLATFRENPGIDLGVARTLPKAGVHVLHGNY